MTHGRARLLTHALFGKLKPSRRLALLARRRAPLRPLPIQKLRTHGATARKVAEELEQERRGYGFKGGTRDKVLATDEDRLEAQLLQGERAMQILRHKDRRDGLRQLARLWRRDVRKKHSMGKS